MSTQPPVNLDDIPEDERYTVPKPRKYPTLLIGAVLFGIVVIAGAALAVPALNRAASPPPPAPSTGGLTVDPSGVELHADTESPTGTILITYADGSTETEDLQAWESTAFGASAGPGETVSIEVRATSAGVDPKHQKVGCTIQAPSPDTDPDGVEVYDSGTRRGVGTVTCTWTRSE